MKNKYGIWLAFGLFLLQIAFCIVLEVVYVISPNYTVHQIIVAGYFVVAAASGFYYGVLRGFGWAKNLIIAAIVTIVSPGLIIVLGMYLINNVFALGTEITSYIVFPAATAFALLIFILQAVLLRPYTGKAARIVAAVLSCVFILSEAVLPVGYRLQYTFKAPTMTGLSVYTKKAYPLVNDADVYLSPDGDDETGDGTFGNPYRTIEKAKTVVRSMDKSSLSGIVVALKKGEYRTDGIVFTEEDGGTESCPVTYCAYGDGEVVINGGVTLDPKDFTEIKSEDMKNRLGSQVSGKVKQLDLSEYGIGKEQYGKIYVIGSHTAASKYDKEYNGPVYSELFFNDTRMNLARYPDTGFIKTGKVVEMGKGLESDGSQTADPDYWEKVRNPKGDTYKLSNALTKRIASWKTLDDVWMFGFWKYTWADATTPIAQFDETKGTLTTEIVSLYGAIEGAPYYFFNVFEELDAPGEWYLDRETGILYLYPPEDMTDAVIDMSLTTEPVVQGNVNYLTLKNLTVKGTRGNGVSISGNNNTVTLCTIKNVGGNALLMTGYNNLASENDITRTGRGGIVLDGGDRETLTPGNNRADNNTIHDWSEIYLTYEPAVTLKGVGNICSHNEMFNSPHEAVTYYGNNHLIEYNDIHDVCLLSDDAGAIYAGRRWDFYGTVIRYNAVYDLGSGEHRPCGIYMDDALSGQTVYGNILVNVPSIGLHMGGGRDLIVKNNIVINTNEKAISYDARAREGVTINGWFDHSSTKGGDMWLNLFDSPWESELWRETYPQYKTFSDDFDNTEDPNFVPNPAGSDVSGNVVINLFNNIGQIHPDVKRFSTVKDNPTYFWFRASSIFVDYQNGDYRLKEGSLVFKDLPDFEEIPVSEIGRY